MRGISSHFFLLVFIFSVAVEAIAFYGLFQSLKRVGKIKKRLFSLLYWSISLYVMGSLFFLFSNPEQLRETTNYRYFNHILLLSFFTLAPKLTLAIFTILKWILSVFNRNISQGCYSAGLIFALSVMLIMGYSITFGKKNIRVENVSLYFDSLPKQLDGLKIMQLSDTHLGSFNENKTVLNKTVEIAEKYQPDIIVFTGDMVNNFASETDNYIDIFKKLRAPLGKIAIQGNHDYGDYFHWKSGTKRNKNLGQIRQAIQDMGFTLLLNSNIRIAIKDTALFFVGVENWGHKPFPQYANLDKAMHGIPANYFSILLSHDPAHWEAQVVPKTNIPLTLSGHTHGMQAGIRIAGIEFCPIWFREKHWGGLYANGKQYLYVNRGLGTVGFAGRIEMRPEITFFTLRQK